MNETGNDERSVTKGLPRAATGSTMSDHASNPDLLPCPFCGEGRIYLNEPTDPRRRGGSINCPACLVVMPGEIIGPKWRNELIGCWNVRASVWRPIETAPKDGTEVLVYVHRRMGPLFMGATNSTGKQWWSRNLGDVKPTHWMPLPAPPEVEA
jgi:hypothetical protein